MLCSLIKFIRPLNIALGILTLFIVGYIVEIIQFDIFLHLSIVLACYMIAGNILNDLMDIEIDKINKPNRFLVKHRIDKHIIISVIILFIVIGSFSALHLNMVAMSIALFFALPLLISYELIFKKMPLIGNIIISLLVASVFIYTEAGLSGRIDTTWKIFLLAFMLNLIREIIKDMQDIQGDSIYNFKTLPITIGISKTIIVLWILSLLFISISLHPVYLHSYSWYYIPLIIITIHLPLLYIISNLGNDITTKDYHNFSNLLKIMIINGVIIILLTS